ncbi:MAG: hypothetical protein OXL96_05660 [Candidatus Poribacteria bacterium]|nr:hypothetical protein [Candidatus Poribacteria bacterium]
MECSGRRCKGFCPEVSCKALAFPAGDLRGVHQCQARVGSGFAISLGFARASPPRRPLAIVPSTVARQLLSPVPPHLQKVESPPSTVAERSLTDRSKPPVVVNDWNVPLSEYPALPTVAVQGRVWGGCIRLRNGFESMP